MCTDWRRFASPPLAPLRLSVALSGSVDRPAGWQALLPTVHAEPDGSLRFEGDQFEGGVGADRREGWVRGPLERLPVEAVIRVLLADSLLRRSGLLVHGVALASQGRAALFTGPSGAGKSTLGQWGREGGLRLISDELVALVPEGGGYTVHGTPWNVGCAEHAALVQIGVLSHARTTDLSPIAPSEVLRVMLSNVVEPAASAQARSAVFRVASQVLAKVPSARLAFVPDLSAARVLGLALAER